MSDTFMDQFIADLVKGAERTEGFMRGGHVGVEVQREHRGREEKLAMQGSTMLGGIPAVGPWLSGLNAAARDDSMPSGALTGLGASVGQVAGGVGGAHAGHALGGLSDNDKLQMIATLVGGGLGTVGGGMLGAAAGRGLDHKIEGESGKRAALENAYVEGVKAAAAQFKVAFLPFLGAIAGPMLARKGLAHVASRNIGGTAHRAMKSVNAGGMGGMGFDMAGSMAGGAAGNMLQGGS
jgi:hypothetical protein